MVIGGGFYLVMLHKSIIYQEGEVLYGGKCPVIHEFLKKTFTYYWKQLIIMSMDNSVKITFYEFSHARLPLGAFSGDLG